MSASLRVLVVRHGQTDDNVQKIYQGQLDTPLNETGRAQAKMLAEHLSREGCKLAALFSSDLCRASETAEILLAHCGTDPATDVVLDCRLRERYMASLQGQPWTLVRDLPEPPDAESRADLAGRGVSFWKSVIVPLAMQRSGGTVAVVAHGALLRTTLTALMSSELSLLSLPPNVQVQGGVLPNTSVTSIMMDPATGLGTIVDWGRTNHLEVRSTDGGPRMVGDLGGGE